MSNPVLLVYSHRPEVRERIITAIGRRPAPDVGRVDYLECSGVHEVIMAIDAQAADIVILDGEAQPTGGMGISRQIHQEAAVIPPIVLVVRRADEQVVGHLGEGRRGPGLPTGSGDRRGDHCRTVASARW